MASIGTIFRDYPDKESPTSIGPVAPVAQEPTKKVPWYDNPGFYAEIGKVGSALLSGSPSLKGLAAAGQVASDYHNAKQLSRAEGKMLSNVAAGRLPMDSFGRSDTMGLTPDQVSKLNQEGLAQRERASMEESRRVADKYKDALIQDMNERRAAKERKEKLKEDTIKGWEDGTIKPPSYVPKDSISLFRLMDADEMDRTLKEMLKTSKEKPNTQFVTDREGRQIIMIDKDTRTKVGEIPLGPAVDSEGKTKALATNTKLANSWTFANMLPALKKSYMDSLGPENKQAAANFARLEAIINGDDPNNAEKALTTLLGYATPKIREQFRKYTNKAAESLNTGKGYPSLTEEDAKQNPYIKQDVTIQDINPQIFTQAKANLEKRHKKLGRPPTPTELKAEYERLLGREINE